MFQGLDFRAKSSIKVGLATGGNFTFTFTRLSDVLEIIILYQEYWILDNPTSISM